MSKPIRYCKAEGCDRRCHGHGYCIVHYKRLLRTGTLGVVKAPNGEPIWYRLARGLGRRERCWIWTGATNANGYGILFYEGRHWLVHRLVNYLLCGPTTKVLHHICREKLCANPRHLEPLSRSEHLRRHALEGWGM